MNLPSFQRSRTVRLLHRFFRTSLHAGRMPSLLSQEVFRARMRSTPARGLEDAVVFLCDVERCLRELSPLERRLVALCVLEDRSEWEAARQFHCEQSTVSRQLDDVLDRLHEAFCHFGLLPPLAALPDEAAQEEGELNEYVESQQQ